MLTRRQVNAGLLASAFVAAPRLTAAETGKPMALPAPRTEGGASLRAALQNESEIVSGIRTAYAADRFAQRQRERRPHRRARLEISADDLARMVKEFAATHGEIVRCPTAYAVPSDQYHN